jgi:hypothetical protein
MLFETLIYRSILKARSMAPIDNKGRIKLNGAVHYLIDKCFFNNQLITVRRLTDQKEDVVSLVRLLNQMKGSCKYLTRKHYFDVLQKRGYEYDYSETQKKQDKYIKENLRMGEAIVIPSELDWEKSANLHSDFDKLSKTKTKNRTTEDIIDNSIFDKLINDLGKCQKLRKHVDHFLAHSLKPEKIERLDEEALQITFEHLWKAQESICKVTKFIGLYLLDRVDYGLLPLPPLNFLQYIEEPLISKEGRAELRTEEDLFQKEIYSWTIEVTDLRK